VPTKTTTVTPAGIITLNDDTSRDAQLTELRAVNYGAAQTLTAPQQVQARTNIGIGGGWSGSFATGAGQTVTVLNGIITNVV